MDAYGRIAYEAALDKYGKVAEKSIEYMRSRPLNSIRIEDAPRDTVTLVTEVEMNSGSLTFRQDLEDQVIRTTRNFSPVFKGHSLEKVNNRPDGVPFVSEENFYPVLYKLLSTKEDWSSSLCFRGCAIFEMGLMEWTEFILANFEDVLNQAGIYGAVGVSQYPYHFCSNVWKAFLELWSPLTNTLHHGNGEMSISLWDLKMLGGLPISGIPYEEFIPENKRLQRDGLYSTTLSELLCVHSRLCVLSKQKFVRWGDWVRHFYRGQLLYSGYGEDTQCISHLQREKFMGFRPTLIISKEGELAAFLAYWLSRFVFPSYNYIIRPETFHMACLMARGIRVSLAPAVLGHIYHSLGKVVLDPRGPGESRSCFPVHYVIGWLGEHFDCLYRRHADSEFPENYPQLKRYAGIKAQYFSITRARLVFRIKDSVEYRPSPFIESKGYFLIDDGNLSEEHFDWLVCIRSSLLPVRIGGELWLEPYYPNRFARQFGFDQGIPANKLQFKVEQRSKCGVEDLAKAQFKLLRTGTGSRFYVPRSSYEGMCTWTYCRWWMSACAPYLGRSVSFVYLTLKKRALAKQNSIFPPESLKGVSAGGPGKIFFPDFGERDPAVYSGSASCFKSKKTHRTKLDEEDRGSKRARYDDLADDIESPRTNHALRSASKQAEAVRKDAGCKSRVQANPRESTSRENPREATLHENPRESTMQGSARQSVSQASLDQSTLQGHVPEPLMKDLVLKSPSPEPKSSEPICEETQHDVGPSLIGTKPGLLLLTWKEPTQLRESGLEAESFSTSPRDHSDSKSGSTEPVNPDACEPGDEGICQPNETSSILRMIFNSGRNERWGDFIISEVEDILRKISLSQPLELITDCRSEVQKSLEMLGPVIRSYGSGQDRFERFVEHVSKTFELADMVSKSSRVVEECSKIDVEHLHDLIRSHEECHRTKAMLDSELSGLNQEFEVLRASEEDVIKVERQAQQLRRNYELAREHLEERIAFLKDSAAQQNRRDEELRQARMEAKEDQLVEFELLKSSHEAKEEEFKRLVNSLRTFGEA